MIEAGPKKDQQYLARQVLQGRAFITGFPGRGRKLLSLAKMTQQNFGFNVPSFKICP